MRLMPPRSSKFFHHGGRTEGHGGPQESVPLAMAGDLTDRSRRNGAAIEPTAPTPVALRGPPSFLVSPPGFALILRSCTGTGGRRSRCTVAGARPLPGHSRHGAWAQPPPRHARPNSRLVSTAWTRVVNVAPIICGVDVSADSLDARIGRDGAWRQFPRTRAGIAKLARFCRHHQVGLVVMEATGGYERLPFAELWAAELPVAVVNPRSVRQFAEAMGGLEKTDKIDAAMIAWYAETRRIVATPLRGRILALSPAVPTSAADASGPRQPRSPSTRRSRALATMGGQAAAQRQPSRQARVAAAGGYFRGPGSGRTSTSFGPSCPWR